MDLSALTAVVNDGVNKHKLYKDAQDMLQHINGLQTYEKELTQEIDKLKASIDQLGRSADAVRQQNLDMAASNQKMLDAAKKQADAIIEDGRSQASKLVGDARLAAKLVQDQTEQNKADEATAREAAHAAFAEHAKIRGQLEDLKAHKAKLVKSLTE